MNAGMEKTPLGCSLWGWDWLGVELCQKDGFRLSEGCSEASMAIVGGSPHGCFEDRGLNLGGRGVLQTSLVRK